MQSGVITLTEKLKNNFMQIDNLLDGKVSMYLHLVRGISAILVVMEHVSGKLFSYSNEPLVVQILFLFNLLGRPAVRVFFVLSGLFIARSILRAIFKGNWSWRSYLINRLTRLYVVLIPALVLTFLLMMTAYYLWGTTYDNDNFLTFMGNLFFLQEILVQTYGTNHPLWSLSFEFWYYMIFPLIALMSFNKLSRVKSFFLFVLTIVLFNFVGYKISLSFIIWMLGALALFLPIKYEYKSNLVPTISFLIFVISLFIRPFVLTGKIFTSNDFNLFLADLSIAISLVFFIHSLMARQNNAFDQLNTTRKSSSINSIPEKLAGMSFSLYLTHQPIIDFVHVGAKKQGFKGLTPNLFSFVIEILIVSVLIVLAYGFSLITESRTNIIRDKAFKISRRDQNKRSSNSDSISVQ